MNFLYFAYGVGLLVGMNILLFIFTLLGAQFIEKQVLETIIHPMFFMGLIIIGVMITHKARPHQYLNSALLALMLTAVMGAFIFTTGVVPNKFNLFLVASFICIELGSILYYLKHKFISK